MTEPLSASADLCGFISCAPVPCLMVRKGLVVLWDNFSPKHTPAPIPKPLWFYRFVWCHHPSSEFNHICVLGRTFAILCQDEKYVCSCLIFPKAFRPVQQWVFFSFLSHLCILFKKTVNTFQNIAFMDLFLHFSKAGVRVIRKGFILLNANFCTLWPFGFPADVPFVVVGGISFLLANFFWMLLEMLSGLICAWHSEKSKFDWKDSEHSDTLKL